MRWEDIELFPQACYEIDVMWQYLERQIESEQKQGLDLDPDFQRAHVWTDAQRTAYLEYSFRGGEVGRSIICATSNWQITPTPNYVLLDGKQRLESVRKFLRDEIEVFGCRFSTFRGNPRLMQFRFKWRVIECKTRADILRTYLNLNGGGTPHTEEDLAKVRSLLACEEV